MRVINLIPRLDQSFKPTELIHITGHQSLSLNSRRAITILWHKAHLDGIEECKDYKIEISELCTEGHKGYEMATEAIVNLMQTLITMYLPDGTIRRVQFLGGNDMDSPDRPSGTLTYSFDRRLIDVLNDSTIWGKISLPILMALSSKYSVSLYENLAQWAGLSHKISQMLTLREFRGLMGVEEGKYEAFGELNKHVIKPCIADINALAPFNISALPIKTGRKVTSIRIGWWLKSPEESEAAFAEIRNTKSDRKARTSGQASFVFDPSPSVARITKKNRIKT
jgi:plasmid replication initiation protein